MSKVLIISHSYIGDGASTVMHESASYWTKKLHWEVDAVLPERFDGSITESIRLSGMYPVKNIVDVNSYDFILINCLQNLAYVERLNTASPIVVWAHEAETILQSSVYIRNNLKRWFSKVAMIIFQTQWQLEVYKEYLTDLPENKIALVPNGITRFNIHKTSVPCTKDIFRIGSLAKITPLKGQADLIRAVHALSSKYKIACEFIGGTEFLHCLEKDALDLLKKNPHLFKILGFFTRKMAWTHLINADLFCFPSHSESFGLAPLEAASYSLPVILADLPVYKYVGWVANHNCLMHEVGRYDLLANQIERAILSPALKNAVVYNGMQLTKRYESLETCQILTNTLRPFVQPVPLVNKHTHLGTIK